MPRVDISKLLPIEQAPKDGTWIWAYWPPITKVVPGSRNKRAVVWGELIVPAR